MNKTKLLSFILLVISALSQAQQDLKKDTVLYLVGYAHLDTEWRWDYTYTINTCLKNTLYDNFKLFEKYPGYVFNFSGANRYRMMKEYYPVEYQKMKDYIAAGRWFPCGSSMEENDVLAPSAESTIRQVLYGNHYFRKEFGLASEEFMLPDCFGFPAHLPTTLAHCGLKGFSTQKLTWGSARGIPFSIGRWQGTDNSMILAAFNPGSYGSKIDGDLNQDKTWKDRIYKNGTETGIYAEYRYYGTGDVGGAPTEGSVEWVEKSLQNKTGMKIVSGPADQLFKDIPADMAKNLPVTKGEFLLTNHSAGSITSHSFMKRSNRKNEWLAYSTEISSTVADWMQKLPYQKERINEAWRLVLGGQFHDILPGTSIPKAYEYSWNDELIATDLFSGVISSSSGAVSKSLNTKVEGMPLVVYNPLPYKREDVAEADISFPGTLTEYVRVFGPDGQEVPSQVTERKGERMKIIFLANVPPVSWNVFDVVPADVPYSSPDQPVISTETLENKRYKVRMNEKGDIVGIMDKQLKKELLIEPARLAFQYEKPQHWPAWNMDWNDRILPPTGYVDGTPRFRIVENGPVRIALEVTREARGSVFIQKIMLSAGDAGNRIEVGNQVAWRTRESSLKAVFPLTASNTVASYNSGLGVVERGNNDSIKFEVPSQMWFDLTDNSGGYGVSILEDCKYGSDKPDDNTLRLTLLYTPGVRKSYMDQATLDFGNHEFMYGIYAHSRGCLDSKTHQQALRLNQPLVVFRTDKHPGEYGKSISFLEISNDNVSLMALKKAEDTDEIIVRVYETSGKEQKNISLSFFSPVQGINETDAQERVLSSFEPENGKLVFGLTPFQPKTFAVRLARPGIKVTPVISEPVSLKYDSDVVSTDDKKTNGSFGDNMKSYPAELWPSSITIDGVEFKTGGTDSKSKNALSCKGQVINLPDGNFNCVTLLAASSEPESKAVFKTGDVEQPFIVSSWEGYFGQWDNRKWEGKIKQMDFVWNDISYTGLNPAYVRNDDIAFFTTHTHLNDTNSAYDYGYVYKYAFELPEGTNSITLPENPAIKIFAVSVSQNGSTGTRIASAIHSVPKVPAYDYKAFEACKKPVITPVDPWIEPDSTIMVSMVTAEPGAEIRYTLDGTEPLPESELYTQPLQVNAYTVFVAKTFKKGMMPGDYVVQEYDVIKSFSDRPILRELEKGLRCKYYEAAVKSCNEIENLVPLREKPADKIAIHENRAENFAFHFDGYINVPVQGIYSFYLTSDDGSQFLVHSQVLIDNDGFHGSETKMAKCKLNRGWQRIQVKMFNGGGDYDLKLEWEGPGIKRSEIPSDIMFHGELKGDD